MGDKRRIKTNENLAWHLLLGVHPFFGPLFSTKGALRPPTAYDNHPFHPTIHPIRPSTYSCEDDLSIEDLI